MKTLLGSGLLLALAGSASAQTGSIAGRALDRQGIPVRAASVLVLTTERSARPDSRSSRSRPTRCSTWVSAWR